MDELSALRSSLRPDAPPATRRFRASTTSAVSVNHVALLAAATAAAAAVFWYVAASRAEPRDDDTDRDPLFQPL